MSLAECCRLNELNFGQGKFVALSLTDPGKRRRRQIWWRIWKWFFVLGVIVLAAGYAFKTGSMLSARKVRVLQEEITQLSGQVQALEKGNRKLAATVETERAQVADWKAAYDRDVPSGEMKKLYARLQKKAEAGVDAERLGFIIDQVSKKRDCDDKVVSKRFIVQTPLFKGANDSVTFAKRTITVTALGASAVGSNGAREAWYDKAQPVTANFTLVGGKVSKATGKLPLHHSMVIASTEHRFTLNVAPARSFATVAYNTCRFP